MYCDTKKDKIAQKGVLYGTGMEAEGSGPASPAGGSSSHAGHPSSRMTSVVLGMIIDGDLSPLATPPTPTLTLTFA